MICFEEEGRWETEEGSFPVTWMGQGLNGWGRIFFLNIALRSLYFDWYSTGGAEIDSGIWSGVFAV